MRIIAEFKLGYSEIEEFKKLDLTQGQKDALLQEYGSYTFGYGSVIGDPRLMLSLVKKIELERIIHICTCEH